MTTKADTLSPKEERFCQEIVRGLSQSDAYRLAYNPTRAKAKTINEMASRLMSTHKITARVDTLRAPVIQEVQLERTEWLKKLIRLGNFDVRKMFDALGNPIPIPELGDAEAAALIGFEFTEDYLGGKDEKKTACSYTQKYRLVNPLDVLRELGKAEAFYKQGADRPPSPLESLPIAFLLEMKATIEQRQRERQALATGRCEGNSMSGNDSSQRTVP